MTLRRHPLIGALCLLALAPAAQAATYTIIDLGDLPGTTQAQGALSINNFGQVTGRAYIGGTQHAFLWTPATPNGSSGGLVDLGGVSPDTPVYINSRGQVAFNGGYPGVGGLVAYLWSPTAPNGSAGTAVPAVSTSVPAAVYGLNDLGQMVGRMYPGTAYFWTPDQPNGSTGVTNVTRALGANGPYWAAGYANFGYATAINNRNQVAGAAVFDAYDKPFVHQNPPATFPAQSPADFGGLSIAELLGPYLPGVEEGAGTIASLNDAGHAAGSRVSAQCKSPVYWDGNTFHTIGTACGYTANAINNHDAVVGQTLLANANGESGGFLYAQGVMTELRALIDPALGWHIQNATGINDKGQIVGVGLHNGATRPFLMTPDPVPVDVTSTVSASYVGGIRCVAGNCAVGIRLTNNGAAPIAGPISLVLNVSGGPAVTLANPTGTTSVLAPAGRRYIDAPAATLAPAAAIDIHALVTNPGNDALHFGPQQVYAGPGKR